MTNEAKTGLPPEGESVQEWIKSEEGKLVRNTVTGIYYHQHNYGKLLEELYGVEITGQLPFYKIDDVEEFVARLQKGEVDREFIQADKLKALKDRMPISGVRNALYLPEIDRMILGQPDAFLMHRTETEVEQRRLKDRGAIPGGQYPLTGLAYTVKSTGWEVLDVYPLISSGRSLKMGVNNLAERGYHLIVGSEDASRYIPPGKDGSYYEILYKRIFA